MTSWRWCPRALCSRDIVKVVQYVVHAYDFTDSGALARRMAIRPDHLDGVRTLRSKGQFHLGGALLNEEGQMMGSMMLVEFDTPGELQDWLDIEPYIVHQVWERWDIKPFRQADV